VTWQVAHSWPSAPPCASSAAWQATQVVGVPRKAWSAWQAAHSTAACRPVSGNAVRLWSKETSRQSLVTWQAAHSWPSAPSCASSAAWQATQVVGVPRKAWSAWQAAHSTAACRSVSGERGQAVVEGNVPASRW
jgi:hypothetical protein